MLILADSDPQTQLYRHAGLAFVDPLGVGLKDREDFLVMGDPLAVEDATIDLVDLPLGMADPAIKLFHENGRPTTGNHELIPCLAGPAEEAFGQVQVVLVGLQNLAFTLGTLLVIFGARPLEALHLPISLLQAALVVGGLAPVAQTLLLAVVGAGVDDFPHGIKQYVRVRGEVHMGLYDEGVDAHGERLVGTFPYQGVSGIDHDLVDPVKQLRGEQADIVFDRL